MPPEKKFTKEEIIKAALDIVREKGVSALTARALGASLGSSSRPIFSLFKSMTEVRQDVIAAAKNLYSEYIARGLAEEQPFKGVGTQYIVFSIMEPKLFQLLFMSEHETIPSLSEVLPAIDDNYEKILLSVQKDNRVDKKFAERLYRHLWIYTHGIATLCATKMCAFKPDEIGSMVGEIYLGLVFKMKGDKND